MALRLIEMVLPEKDAGEIPELLKQQKMIEHSLFRSHDGEILVRILLDAEQSEPVLDLLEKRFAGRPGNRLVMLPVEATLPRIKPDQATTPGQPPPERIDREELLEDIQDASRCSRVYLAMVALSTIVVTVGLYQNSVAVIIGAMVMAPLLGPNMALALGTTLGDWSLLRRAFLTGLAGILLALALSVMIGATVHVDPTLPEVVARTRVGLGDIAVALASGCAGALAFTTGVSAVLIGVMVAVALLPPLATFGLLLGGGHLALATGALSLFLMNLICVNLVGVLTFVVQGIQPMTWWEKGRAAKATRIAIGLSLALLAALASLILLLHKGQT